MNYVARVGVNKAFSHTVDRAKNIANERLNVQGSSPSLNSEIKYTRSNLRLGFEKHKTYRQGMHDGENFIKEYRLPSGKKIDFLDIQNSLIYELKPFNPRAIKLGEKQLRIYKHELEAIPEFKGKEWKTILETY